MTTPGSLFEKLPSREKLNTLFTTELRTLLFSIALLILGLEAFLLIRGDVYALSAPGPLPRGSFVLVFTLFFLLFSALENLFALFTGRRTSAILSLLPAALLLLLLQSIARPTPSDLTTTSELATTTSELATSELAASIRLLTSEVSTAAAARLFFTFLPRRDLVLQYGTFLLDAAAIYLYLTTPALTGKYTTDKILFISLVILTLSCESTSTTEENRI